MKGEESRVEQVVSYNSGIAPRYLRRMNSALAK